MEVHKIKSDEEIDAFCKNKTDAITLLIIGLCEIHSNAEMFGGINSTSFKIKWKKLNSKGNKIIKRLKSQNSI
tara:strand:+ start:9918 stop:10136 length:219 start_codon:yes stop_codon:yes gene_type:complete